MYGLIEDGSGYERGRSRREQCSGPLTTAEGVVPSTNTDEAQGGPEHEVHLYDQSMLATRRREGVRRPDIDAAIPRRVRAGPLTRRIFSSISPAVYHHPHCTNSK